jgi:broad specificity polyphosphatase/5'/3'-nucleotidase SurE
MLSLTSVNAAADEPVFQGKWLGKDAGVSLQLDKSGAQFSINGQIFKDASPEFFTNKLNHQSFLYVNAPDVQEAQREHRLYLLCNSDASAAHPQSTLKPNLIGYYDIASLNQAQTAKLQSSTIQFSPVAQPTITIQTAALNFTLP